MTNGLSVRQEQGCGWLFYHAKKNRLCLSFYSIQRDCVILEVLALFLFALLYWPLWCDNRNYQKMCFRCTCFSPENEATFWKCMNQGCKIMSARHLFPVVIWNISISLKLTILSTWQADKIILLSPCFWTYHCLKEHFNKWQNYSYTKEKFSRSLEFWGKPTVWKILFMTWWFWLM